MVAKATLDDVTEAMKDVIDPELGINVIDLGLVYDISIWLSLKFAPDARSNTVC